MLHKKVDIPKENFYEIMTKLGSIYSTIEFEDLNKNEIESSKSHYPIINRCDEIETIFNHLDDILVNQFNINCELYDNYDDFQTHLNFEIKKNDKKIKEKNFFDVIENFIVEEESKIKIQYNLNKQQLDIFHKLLEKKYIYEKMIELFEGKIINDGDKDGELKVNYLELSDEEEEINLIRGRSSSFNCSLSHLCGICETENVIKLQRIIFRAGKSLGVPSFYYPTFNNIIYDEEKYLENKQIFLVTITGRQPFEKIRKTIEVLNCETFIINKPSKVKKDLEIINTEVSNQLKVIKKTTKALLDMIKPLTNPVKIEEKNYKCLFSLYRTFCKREKYIYTNLNKCLDLNMFYVGDVWIPKISFNYLKEKLNELTKENVNITLPIFLDSENLESKVRTYFQMDDFVYPFQAIVNSYGIPRYKEVNPGLFSIITFPFLFGIMFGDIGHGFLIVLFAIYIEINRKQIYESNSILKGVIHYRYIFLLMGFFSFFCGLIYNDFMAIPLSIFQSCYLNVQNTKIAIKKEKCTYPLGMDPKWYSASNELTFTNSFKMKLSVIVGVIQMTLGIVLRGLNNLFFKDYLGFFVEFIPQFIFMNLLFGYMIALIFIKWSTDYTGNTQNAPSLITILINIALKNGSVDGQPVWSTVEIEERTNQIFFYVAILCIPIILLPKPIVKILEMKKYSAICEINNNVNINLEENINNDLPLVNKDIALKEEEIKPLLENDDLQNAEIQYDSEKSEFINKNLIQNHEKEEYPSDIFVHQIIETIEFVLGCVSNTASYLRLWALSLAHAQLSKVFFEKSLLLLAVYGNFILVIIGYFIFANITISVLMGMDLLEAFLHTLRLHWVEFQNKFYYADGTEFCPFSFDLLLNNGK